MHSTFCFTNDESKCITQQFSVIVALNITILCAFQSTNCHADIMSGSVYG
jgi:hypothetical protein